MNFLRCFFADEDFPGSQHVVVFRAGKSARNVLAAMTIMEENLSEKFSNITSYPNDE